MLMEKYETTILNINITKECPFHGNVIEGLCLSSQGIKSSVFHVQMGHCSLETNLYRFHTEKEKHLLLSWQK